jgi:CDP-diglyceride synthetase
MVAGLIGLLYLDYQRIRTDPRNMLVIPLLVGAVCLGALLEVYRMMRIRGLRPAWLAGFAFAALKLLEINLLLWYPEGERQGEVRVALVLAGHAELLLLLYLLLKLVAARPVFSIEDAAATLLAPFYVLLLRYAISLHGLVSVDPLQFRVPNLSHEQVVSLALEAHAAAYMHLLFFLLLASKLPDMLGYIVGKTMGRHPMAPILSPSKTWEGGIAGFLGGFLGSMALVFLGPLRGALGLREAGLIVLCAAVTISAILGDLVKSAFKRWAGVKDSGLIPEFGGVLDIVDSFLLSAPAAYLFISLAKYL